MGCGKKTSKKVLEVSIVAYYMCVLYIYRWHIFNALTENETSMQQEKLRQNGECGPYASYAYCTCMRCVTTVT